MTKIKLEQLDNAGKPTGVINEVDQELAEKLLNRPAPKWREAKEKKSTKKDD